MFFFTVFKSFILRFFRLSLLSRPWLFVRLLAVRLFS